MVLGLFFLKWVWRRKVISVTSSPVSHTLFSNFAPNSYHPEVGRNLKIGFSQKVLMEKISFWAHFKPWLRYKNWYFGPIACAFFLSQISFRSTMCWQEDLGKFPNCLNSIPNENLGLKKENEQYVFWKYVWTKKSLLLGENCWSRPKIMIFSIST